MSEEMIYRYWGNTFPWNYLPEPVLRFLICCPYAAVKWAQE